MLSPFPIPRIPVPSFEKFHQNYVRANKPVVITGMLNDWPALELWDWEYFEKNFSEVGVGAIKLRDGVCDAFENKGAPFENTKLADALDSITKGKLDGLAVVSGVNSFPEAFHQAYRIPVYCKGKLFQITRLFLGPKGAKAALHQDYPENIYVIRFSRMPTYSNVDVENPDYEKYPEFKNAQPYVVDLKGGETLFMPSFWWHHVRNLEPSISMHFWWSRGWLLPVAGLAAIYNKWIKK